MASTGDGVTEDASPAPTASSTVGSTTATEAPSTSPATPATPAPTPIVSQQPTVAPTMSIAPSGGGVDGTPGPFGESVGFDETPSPSSGGSEGGPQVTERPSAAPVGDDVGGGDATPSPSGSAEVRHGQGPNLDIPGIHACLFALPRPVSATEPVCRFGTVKFSMMEACAGS